MPAAWRHKVIKSGEKSILLRPDLENPMLEGMDHSRMGKIAASLDDESQYPSDAPLCAELAKIVISQFQSLDFDTNGRILLSEELISHAALKDRVLFAGVGLTLQVWEPGHYQQWMDDTLREGKAKKIELHLKPPKAGRGD